VTFGAHAALDPSAKVVAPAVAATKHVVVVPSKRPTPSIALSATGDVTLGEHGSYPRGGARTLLAGVRRYLRGDVVLGNLETVLGDDTRALQLGGAPTCPEPPDPCFNFIAPAAFALGLRSSGFTVLNLANNHASDFGRIGETMTTGALASARLRWTGKPAQITSLRQHGVRVAVIGAAPYPWAQNLLDVSGTARLVRSAAQRAQIVIVTMHLGAEGAGADHVRPGMETFFDERRGDPVAFAHAMVDAGADVVVGHGPHVLRGLEWYRGRLIAYSLGNLSGFHTLNTSGPLGISAILHVRLKANGTFVAGNVTPVRLDPSGTPRFDPTRAAFVLLRQLSRADFGARAVRITKTGSLRVPEAARPLR
jgi:poly-gamma-glutamate capsule biosynthesis protein CapA/YwtB (metallophosphatase superfamily)